MKTLLKNVYTILVLSLPTTCLMAQAPAIQWQKSLGGSLKDQANAIQTTADGGYIVAGYAKSNDGDVSGNHGLEDYWISKLDNTGSIQWQKAMGGSGNDVAHAIHATADGGYIVAGRSGSNDGDVTGQHGIFDFWVLKFNNAGAIEWQKSLGGSHADYAYSVQPAPEGGYIVVGHSSSDDGDVTGNHGNFDFWIVKLDIGGGIEWQKSLGGSNVENAHSVQPTPDGGYIVAGSSRSNDGDVSGNHGNTDFWVVKLNGMGAIQWQKSLGGTDDEAAYSVQLTPEGGYIVAGSSRSNDGDVSGNHGDADTWIVKLDNIGTIEWQKSLGGSLDDRASAIELTADGEYIVAGYTESNDGDVSGYHGSGDNWIVKLDIAGTIQWQKAMGGFGNDSANDIKQTTDGGYIVAGYSNLNDGDVSGNHGSWDYWVVKLEGETAGVEDVFAQETKIYPNPVKDTMYFSEKLEHITVYSLIGAEILEYTEAESIDLKRLAPATYILKAQTMDGRWVTKKFIKNN